MVISKINSNFAAQFSNCNFNIGIWCNGNTTDSGPVILGSSPSIPTFIKVFSFRRKHFFDFLKTAFSLSSSTKCGSVVKPSCNSSPHAHNFISL